jgi:hypothetical protein
VRELDLAHCVLLAGAALVLEDAAAVRHLVSTSLVRDDEMVRALAPSPNG